MFHLFNSAVRVERLQLQVVGGQAVMDYAQATDPDPALNAMLQFLKCRLDMNFIRQGKDIPPAPVAGRAPDRIGIMFTFPYAPIKAGDRIIAIPNEQNKIPVKGTFEIRPIPDEAVGFSDQHHIEVQITETGQELTSGNWPSEEPIEDDEEEP
jgi:hypothetical protein